MGKIKLGRVLWTTAMLGSAMAGVSACKPATLSNAVSATDHQSQNLPDEITVTSVSPTTSSLDGTPITVIGTGFVGSIQVTVGDVPCENLQVQSSTHLTCRSPLHSPDPSGDTLVLSVMNSDTGVYSNEDLGITYQGEFNLNTVRAKVFTPGGCFACHGASPAGNTFNMTDDAQVIARSQDTNALSGLSTLETRISEADDGKPQMPLGGAPLSIAQLTFVSDWIYTLPPPGSTTGTSSLR